MERRFSHIDFLRSVCIIGFIAIHVLSYNLISSINTFIWNYLHFVVGGFIFCSGYVLAKYETQLNHFVHLFAWYYKRITRLIVPYWWYIFIYLVLLFFFPSFFSGIGMKLSAGYIVKSLFFWEGGSNFSWLPLLFLQLTVIFPFLLKLSKRELARDLYILFALFVTLVFSVIIFPYQYYRLVMWIPWSLVLMLGVLFYKKEKTTISFARYVKLGVYSGIIFFVLHQLWQNIGKPMQLIDNKYPPNFYDISYEVFGTSVIVLLWKLGIFGKRAIQDVYTFLSEQSYSIFFIHIIVLDFIITFKKRGGAFGFLFEFFFVLFGSVLIAILLRSIRRGTR